MRRVAHHLLAPTLFAAAVLLSVPTVSAEEGSGGATIESTADTSPDTSVTGTATDDTAPAVTVATGDTAPADTTVDSTTGDAVADPTSSEPETSAPADDAEQQVVISDVAVAVADTGGNEQTGDSLPVSAEDLATGAAQAIGSLDDTSVTQSATVELSDQATADVVQIAIVFNVGIAGANTGATTAGGGGASTGDASATGLDAQNYLTQGAAATAPTGTDSASQLTVALNLGIAVANTGGNAAGGSGDASTGGALAIGNQSVTDVDQSAELTASGNGSVSVNQQVLVLNLGVALANTGGGDVSAVAAALLQTPSDDLAAQLFNMLLPALMSTVPAAGGGGATSTGSATAVGNQSVTQVAQTAEATASGDGTASVDQQIVVANMGAAVANTGLNGAATSVDEAAVQQLATFFAELLIALQTWATSDHDTSQQLSFSVPLGDYLIALDGQLNGTVGSPMEGATIHQMAAVINIGVAVANSGGNTGSSTATGDIGAVAGAGGSIATGDATARNSTMVIVCQLADSTATCLLPPAEESEPPVDDAAGAAGGLLPVTGAATMLRPAAAMVLFGAGLLVSARRRRTV